MRVYRLSKEKYKDDLSGKGAEIASGRWNSKGVAMLYTSESRALCTTEIAVHSPLGIIPIDYWLTTIEFPDTIEIQTLDEASLPKDWKALPSVHATQITGDNFIAGKKHLVMKVPSAVVQGDHNYLINPTHPLFSKVKIVKSEIFEFDSVCSKNNGTVFTD